MSAFQMENVALGLRGKTMMLLAWKLRPKTKWDELVTSGVFGVFPELSQCFTTSGYTSPTHGALKLLQIRKREETGDSWVFRKI